MVKRSLFLFVAVLFFNENVSFPADKSSKNVTNIRSYWEKDTSSGCADGWDCTPVANCYGIVKLVDETAFPCSNYGEALKICCPPSKVTTLATTKKVATTTVATKISTSNENTTRWSKFPKLIQDKAKLLPASCGPNNADDKIFNGKIANLGQFPWMALIGHEVDGVKQFWCGGTIINKRYILTAAHCINIGTIQPKMVRLGEWNVTSDNDCVQVSKDSTDCSPPVLDIDIEETKVHEKFGNRNLPSFRNDIALIRLAKDIQFDEFVSPICLHPEVPKNLTSFTVAGWGVSEPSSIVPNPVLQYADILLYNFRECNTVAFPETKPLSKTQFCAVGKQAENSCKGDSGGPVTYYDQNDQKHYQKGIVSFATTLECGEEGKPTIYTEVAQFVEWILKTIR